MDNNLSGMMASRPDGTNGSNTAPGVSIGNYKGVMLCNRPFAGLVTSKAGQGQGDKGGDKPVPFLPSALPDEPLGLNPIRNRPLALAQIDRAKRDSAVNRHRRYIKQLQKEKRDLQKELEEQTRIRDARRARFRKKQREMREKVISLRHNERKETDDDCHEEFVKQREMKQKEEIKKAYLKSIGATEEDASSSLDNGQKPKWAMTANEVECDEEHELDGLLEFASGLNIDEYLDDLEVKSALEAVKARVRQLKIENEREEREYKASFSQLENRALDGIPSSLLDTDDDDNGQLESQEQKYAESKMNEDAISITSYKTRNHSDLESKYSEMARQPDAPELEGNAEDGLSVADARSILSTTSVKSMRSIHSTKSISKLAEGVLRRMSLSSVEESDYEQKRNDVVLQPPRIVQINEDGGTRLGKKDQVNNLPYMHRNPAI